jgi:phospholipase/carboxylesterase
VTDDPHGDQPLVTRGASLDGADAALVLVHGRGSNAESIAALADDLPTEGVAVLAPQAADDSWYPESFTAPVAANEPGRTSALRAVDRTVARATDAGVAVDRVVLVGFSQGACVAAEYVARTPRRYGGLAVLAGGLVGETLADDYAGDLDGTPVFLGCSDDDPWIPEARVHDSAAVFEALGADVTVDIYPDAPHAVLDDERERVAAMLARVAA